MHDSAPPYEVAGDQSRDDNCSDITLNSSIAGVPSNYKEKYEEMKRQLKKAAEKLKRQKENKSVSQSKFLLPVIEFNTNIKTVNHGDRAQIGVLVKTVVFKRQKFITDDEMRDLSHPSTLPNRIMNLMNYNIENRYAFWSTNAVVVKKTLEKLRTQKTTAMRNEFYKVGKIHALEKYFFFFFF
jgi:hypothetical protein